MVKKIAFQRNEPSVSLKVAMLLSTAFLDYKNYMVVPFLAYYEKGAVIPG